MQTDQPLQLPYVQVSTQMKSGAALGARRDLMRGAFSLALLFSTWIPMAFFLSLKDGGLGKPGFQTVRIVLLFLSAAHVPATLLFYSDKEFLKVIRANKIRYVYLPIAAIIASGLLFVFVSQVIQAFMFLAFWAWQAHHYGRQNVGVYSFVSISNSGRSPHKLEKRALQLAAVCAVCGTFKILGTGVTPPYLQRGVDLLYEAGFFGFIAVIIFSAYVYFRNIKDTTFIKTVFFVTLVLFFFPIFLSNNFNVTFLSYAIAHGVQYITFMTVLSLNTEKADRRSVTAGVIKLTVIILLVGVVFYRSTDLRGLELAQNSFLWAKSIDFLIGAFFGATIAHFIIDAGAWKLSNPSPRAYMMKKFGFVLNPSA